MSFLRTWLYFDRLSIALSEVGVEVFEALGSDGGADLLKAGRDGEELQEASRVSVEGLRSAATAVTAHSGTCTLRGEVPSARPLTEVVWLGYSADLRTRIRRSPISGR